MATQLKEVEQQALELSPHDREVLADRLIHSLDDEPLSDVDEAWIQEAERRYQDYKNGKVKGIPGDQVFGKIRRELGWQN